MLEKCVKIPLGDRVAEGTQIIFDLAAARADDDNAIEGYLVWDSFPHHYKNCLTQVGLESPSCIEDGCPCTKVSHQEIPVQESQSPNANRISGAESDQGWLSLQMEQSSLSAEESRLEVRHPSQDVWCTTKERFSN